MFDREGDTTPRHWSLAARHWRSVTLNPKYPCLSLSCLVTNILGFEMTRVTQGHGEKEQEME